MYRILLAMGFVLLGHAAYSAVQCERMSFKFVLLVLPADRSFLRVTEQQYSNLPMDVRAKVSQNLREYVLSLDNTAEFISLSSVRIRNCEGIRRLQEH